MTLLVEASVFADFLHARDTPLDIDKVVCYNIPKGDIRSIY